MHEEGDVGVKPPLVSVVIPAYNAAGFISRTLKTVAAQTFRDFEAVVVDDGSKDGTAEAVLRELSGLRLPGRCLRQENRGIAAARNAGMAAARGEFIALLDHDDLWAPEKLDVVMREFSRHPETDLVGHHIRVTQNGETLRIARKGPARLDMYERLLLEGNALSPSAAVFRKEKALSIGGFREEPSLSTVEDYDFWMRLSRVGTFRFVDRVLAEYPVAEGTASRRVDLHHGNLEVLLRRHFAEYFGARPGVLARLRMRRRLAMVYRAAAGELLRSGAPWARQWGYLRRMLAAWPLDWKNLGRTAECALRAARRPIVRL